MKCAKKGCNGEVNTKTLVTHHRDKPLGKPAFRCTTCGRIHWADGTLIPDQR